MNKILLAIAASLAAGLAAGAWLLAPRKDAPPPIVAPMSFDSTAAVEDRIAALESAVSDEREARRVLEDELIALYGELDALRAGPEAPATRPPVPGEEPVVIATSRGGGMRFDRGPSNEEELQALIDEGFSPERARYIQERESTLRYEFMQNMYRARTSNDPTVSARNLRDAETVLRDELGETDYEKYLRANNRSTAVGVREVMTSSPAAAAGLQPGDEIIRYDGDRVYSSRELMERTWAGEGSGNVVVEVLRDGVPMQVTLPRGPIGIELSRGR